MISLVTGGAGFIGRRLVERLLDDGDRVIVLDDLSSGDGDKLDGRAELVVGSILDAEALARACQGVNRVFHLAAIASVARCNEDLTASHRVNLTGFVGLLEILAQGASRPALVYASSAAVYGDNPEVPLLETAGPRPLSPYGADKLGCELHAAAAAAVYGLNSTGFRFFNVYGPGQDPSSPYSGVISRFVEKMMRGEPVVLHGDGLQTRDFVFVDDVVDALVRGSARQPDPSARVYNVCTGRETTIRQLAEMLREQIGSKAEITSGPTRPGDIRRSIGSLARGRDELGLKAPTSLDQGLKLLVEAMRA